MRVISQNGVVDAPYENFVFSITKDNYIVATRYSIGRPSEIASGIMAKYSTLEKAEKAMKLLREVYVVNEDYKRLSDDLKSKISKVVSEEVSLKCGCVFQFPKEEDLL